MDESPFSLSELRHLLELHEKTSGDEWRTESSKIPGFSTIMTGKNSSTDGLPTKVNLPSRDAQFIAAAREALPRLIAEVKRLRTSEVELQASNQNEEINSKIAQVALDTLVETRDKLDRAVDTMERFCTITCSRIQMEKGIFDEAKIKDDSIKFWECCSSVSCTLRPFLVSLNKKSKQ